MSEKTRYRSRAALAVGTPVRYRGTPSHTSTLEASSSGVFTVLQSEALWTMEFATSDAPSASRTLDMSASDLNGLVAEINDQHPDYLRASVSARRLVLSATANGAGSWLRINAPGAGAADFAAAIGFPIHPDPEATVYGDETSPAPQRTINPTANASGRTRFPVAGEERSAEALNRALHAVATNCDILRTYAQTGTSQVVAIEITDAWEAMFTRDADGFIDEINLEGVDFAFYVGAPLSGTSSLSDIQRIMQLVDGEGVPVQGFVDGGWGVTGAVQPVRIGLVTNGPRSFAVPVLSDSDGPSPAILDAEDTADGKNVLGVDRLRCEDVTITAIVDGMVLSCADATFETDGVAAGDVVTIDGSTQTVPFDNNGAWAVSEVISETRISVVPYTPENTGRLNADEQSGALGVVQVSTGGVWASGIAITLSPPLPCVPARGLYLLACVRATAEQIVQHEDGARILPADIAARARNGREDDLRGALRNAAAAGARLTSPIHLYVAEQTASDQRGESTSSGTGTMRGGWVFRASERAFTDADVGSIIEVSGGVFDDGTIFRIVRNIDDVHVQLQPTGRWTSDAHSGSATELDYAVYAGSTAHLPAAILIETPAATMVDGDAEAQRAGGIVVVQEQHDPSSEEATPLGIHGLLYLRRVQRVGESNALIVSALFDGGANIELSENIVDAADNLFPEASSEARGSPLVTKGGTYVRVLNGQDAGWYRLRRTESDSTIRLLSMDGATRTFSAEAGVTPRLAFYNISFGASVPLGGDITEPGFTAAGLVVDIDGAETGADTVYAGLFRWRGSGSGVRIEGNDAEFHAADSGYGSKGWAVDVIGYAPMDGVHVVLDADTAAAAGQDSRRAKGALFDVRSSVYDLEMYATPSNLRGVGASALRSGYGLRVHQRAYDPAAILTRSSSDATAAIQYPSGALLVIRDAGEEAVSSGIWGAIDMTGSLYQRDLGTGGGIFSETGMGAGRWLRPIHPLYAQPNTLTNEYDRLEDNGRNTTELGGGGQAWPESVDGPGPGYTYGSGPPDYEIFNCPHVGVFVIEAPDDTLASRVLADRARWIGLRMTSAGAASHNGMWTVVAVNATTGVARIRFAVDRIAATGVLSGTQDPTSILLHSARWYRGYVDVASWMQFGTAVASRQAELPTAHTTSVPTDTDHPIYAEAPQTGAAVSETGMTADMATVSPALYGVGARRWLPVSEMSGVAVAPGSYTDGWQADAGEPASPFPDAGVICGKDTTTAGGTDADLYGAIARSDNPSVYTPNLRTDDVVFEQTSGADGRLSMIWSKRWGGCLSIGNTPGELPGGECTGRVSFRGAPCLVQRHFAVAARVTIALTGGSGTRTRTLGARLVGSDGDTVATASQVVSFTDTAPVDVTFSFTDSDLTRAPADAMEERFLPVHLRLTLTDVAWTYRYYILRASLVTQQRLVEWTGAMRAEGTISAAAFRFNTPVSDVLSIAPVSAVMLTGTDYGKSWVDGADIEQEWAPMIGVLKRFPDDLPAEPAVDLARLYRQSPFASTLIGNLVWNDPLAYVDRYEDMSYIVAFPGRTGFVIPLNLPHGSLLTRLDLSLSFAACISPPNTATGGTTNFCVWHTIPFDRSDAADAWYEKAAWDNNEGVRIRLWRAASWERGQPDSIRGTFAGSTASPYGYAEQIHEAYVDLADVDEPLANANGSVSTEHPVLKILDLIAAEIPIDMLTVDNRVFSYMITIEFWIGMRNVDVSGDDDVYDISEYNDNHTPDTMVLGVVSSQARTQWAPCDYSMATSGDKISFPPKVSFRGGKVFFRRDRP